jgi:cyclopropane fatty-acyl-phospholipid synthase-like methyltransferase
VRAVIEGPGAVPIGRALDLGCGTGTNVIYLAQHGWEVVGVDFSARAIQRARQKANGIAGARFVAGDVTRLRQLDLQGPFDFVLDIGTYHGLPTKVRHTYVQGVVEVTRPGTLLLMWEIADRMTSIPGAPTMQANEIADRFGKDFVVERVESGKGRWSANWVTLRRR